MMTPNKKKRFAVVDYQMGNIKSVINAFRFLGENAYIAETKEQIDAADAIIIPGVGAFSQAMKNIVSMGIIDILNKKVITQKTPFLGICLGMQLVADSSTEGGFYKGLGWIPGSVEIIPVKKGTPLPHIGWNEIQVVRKEPLFINTSGDFTFYFVHSFCFNCNREFLSSTTFYDTEITASVQKENIFAVQFHPEKSQSNGLKLLRQFATLVYEY